MLHDQFIEEQLSFWPLIKDGVEGREERTIYLYALENAKVFYYPFHTEIEKAEESNSSTILNGEFLKTSMDFFDSGILSLPFNEIIIIDKISKLALVAMQFENKIFCTMQAIGEDRKVNGVIVVTERGSQNFQRLYMIPKNTGERLDEYTELFSQEIVCNTVVNTVLSLSLAFSMPIFKDAMQEVFIEEKLQKVRAKRGRPTLRNYTNINLGVVLKYVRPEEGEKGTHKSPIPHWRRGHIRTYSTGRKVGIPPTLVNSIFGQPEDRKTYIVSEDQDEEG